jgi:hypothetical protein
MSDAHNRKAKEDWDLLERLSNRQLVGERILRRVGKRAFERPNVAISHRLYAKYNVLDPWDPKPVEEDSPIRLGPVSLRLGEAKRQPGRHLMPKEPKKKRSQADASQPPQFRPQGIPKARPKVNQPPPPPPKPEPSHRPFGGQEHRQLVGKIPVRPDRDLSGSGERTLPSPQPSAQQKPGGSRLRRTRSQGQPTVRAASEQSSSAAHRQLPPVQGQPEKEQSSRRLRRTQSRGRPVVRSIASEPPPAPIEPPAQPEILPEPKAPSPSGNNVGLDDLFSASTSKMERPRLRRKKK